MLTTTIGELLGGELELVPKLGAAVGQWTNTIMVWDRQHRMQERFMALAAWIQQRVGNSNGGDENSDDESTASSATTRPSTTS